MYTILVNADNTLTAPIKTNIMHRSSMVDTMRFLAETDYKGFDMTTAQCTLEYVLPVSRTYIVELLQPQEALYEGRLDYRLPLSTKFTAEAGIIELKLTFTFPQMNENGKVISRVRKTSSINVKIIPVEQWSEYIPETDLDAIAQAVLMLQAQNAETLAAAQMLQMTKADNIAKDAETNEFYLTSNGQEIGDRVKDLTGDEEGIPSVIFDDNSFETVIF